MAEWKGVPYFFDATGKLQEQVSVVVGKIPQVVVETSFSWETVISAFFAALIPSFIAWYALKNNYKLAEYQNNLSAKEKWIGDFRSALAEYVAEASILTAKLITLPSCVTRDEERAAEFSKYKLLLLLSSATECEIKLAKNIVSINNLIVNLKKNTNGLFVNLQSRKDTGDEIQKYLQNLMVNSRDVILAKYGNY
ncbi:hypothetical protein JC794_16260 [Morganella morganii]|uniref:hypothetical protein n=1 Tax=Morganella morganii TaxID=582 RepID=UPI000EE6FDE5|nr:hypothetical protein [Morganella morganii]HAE76639.1 hypothetical protein [Morganella sp. (in: enterobacteria)]QXO53161.1 hypothetical protein JC830_15905 [Morganella morganii]QXO57038.1 hypothetical protein JC827_16275 [Morganella morganii]QXO75998.1 hypothetical protein JC794_16260 [Morganella morganii]QXO79804.1 hypothetical protein JA116_15535 [Morganella morganii]